MVTKFTFTPTPHIIFGAGSIKKLPKLLESYGNSVLLVTGKQSFIQSDHWDRLLLQFEAAKIHWTHYIVDKEPSPYIIDQCTSLYKGQSFDAVVAIGGGSVVDGGKAISAMLCQEGIVRDYLEGVGTKQPTGEKILFIAVPTTAGTGSEATKNAVISELGEQGFKKSLRHDKYIPDVALVDPELLLNCPKSITAQSGMDAFTQLLESYVSTHANPITDALAVDGIRNIRDGLVQAVNNGSDLSAREKMAYASMLSGIALANAGLGTVHGFASSIGGLFNIPHGLVCAVMMGPVNQLTIRKLRAQDADGVGLNKYGRAGKLFSRNKNRSDEYYIDLLLDTINSWSDEFGIRKLGEFGLKKIDLSTIAAKTGNKYNPVELDKNELEEALEMAL